MSTCMYVSTYTQAGELGDCTWDAVVGCGGVFQMPIAAARVPRTPQQSRQHQAR